MRVGNCEETTLLLTAATAMQGLQKTASETEVHVRCNEVKTRFDGC